MLVAIGNALLYFDSIGGAKVSGKTSLASNALKQLILSVPAAEAESHEVSCGETASALRRERALAVECIVGINGASMIVSSH